MAGLIVFELLNQIENENNREQRLRYFRRNANIIRNLRDVSNPFEIPERQFRANFRLSREGARYLIDTLSVHFRERQRATRVSPMITVSTYICLTHLNAMPAKLYVDGKI